MSCLQNDARLGFPYRVIIVVVQFGVVQFIKQPTVDHLLLPLDGHCTCAELPEEFLILGVKLNVLDLRGDFELVCILGIDHVGLWHPGRFHLPRLQTMETDAVEKCVVSGVTTASREGKKQVTYEAFSIGKLESFTRHGADVTVH